MGIGIICNSQVNTPNDTMPPPMANHYFHQGSDRCPRQHYRYGNRRPACRSQMNSNGRRIEAVGRCRAAVNTGRCQQTPPASKRSGWRNSISYSRARNARRQLRNHHEADTIPAAPSLARQHHHDANRRRGFRWRVSSTHRRICAIAHEPCAPATPCNVLRS